MRRLACPRCAAEVFFDAAGCVACGTAIAFDPCLDRHVAVGDGVTRCAGHGHHGCPWVAGAGGWCRACALDLTREEGPPADPERVAFERAVRRVVRQFLRLGIDPAAADPPLRFSFGRSSPESRVTIGHADGLVTLDLAEADPVTVQENRCALGEPYRTPLGHVRHETGHWHWQLRVAGDPEALSRFRRVFGDERADYGKALEAHYARVDDGSWRATHVSSYSAAHPWEDYAESFAHVLHLLDTLETAVAHGLALVDPDAPFDDVYGSWVRVTVVLNELSRSMGVDDAYPFAPSAAAVDKFRFVHDLLVPPWGAVPFIPIEPDDGTG